MAKLNFPNPAVTQTYTEAGITWTWNATLGVWSSETADGIEGTSVSVGPNPPADAEQGDLWWNNSEDSGRLYVYYSDGNSEQWVEASPEGSGLTENDADGLYLSKVNDDTAAGEITFEKLSTHEAGVSVTGGDAGTIGYGILSDANGTRIIHNGLGVLAGNNGLMDTAVSLAGTTRGGSNDKDGVKVRSIFVGTSNLSSGITSDCDISNFACSNYRFFSAGTSLGTPDPGKVFGTSTVYSAPLSTAVGRNKAYGFYTDYPENGTVNYGFYAAGDAPNYFAGKVTVAGDTALIGSQTTVVSDLFLSTSPLATFRGASTATDAFAVNAGLYQKADVTDGAGLRITAGTSNGFARTGYKGIDIVDFKTNNAGETRYGVYSALTTSGTGVNYNFYAAGGAPSYFAGEIYVGGGSLTSTPNYVKINSSRLLSYTNNNYSFLSARDTAGTYCVFKAGGTAGGDTTTGTINLNSGLTNINFDAGPGGTHTSTSDYRIKQNVTPLESAVDAIKALNPVSYKFTNGDTATYQGFIAHELQTTIPTAVIGEKDAEEAIGTHTDAEGVVTADVTEPEAIPYGATWVQTGTRPVYQGVDQTKLIPLLTKALQEALSRIEALENA